MYEKRIPKNKRMPMKLVIDKGLTNCPNEEIQAQFDRLCDEQEKIDSTGFGEVFKCLNEVVLKGANRSVLFPFTEDVKAIQKALELTGHSKDEAFCERFMRHYRLFVEGKDLQARGLQIKASCLPQIGKQAGGWYFVPISIFVPQEAKDIQAAVNDILEKDAKEGKGLFANVTQIEKEDEALDEFLCVEAYNCKHSFTKYLAELKQHKVVGKEGAFLNPDFTRCLFATLKTCADIIKDNTDSPNNVKNKLNDVIATFDNIPIWGLFFQILVLQGLCQMLVSLDINEGDNGFDEAQDLCNWICEALATKEISFAFGFYGDKDLVMLEPFCEYLCTTDVGKEIQEQIRREYYPEPQPENAVQEIPQNIKDILPEKLQKDDAVSIFKKAIDAQMVKFDGKSLVWKGTKQLLAYFAQQMSERFTLSVKLDKDENKTTDWKTFETLFNQKKLKQAKQNWMRVNTKFEPTGFKEVDAIM